MEGVFRFKRWFVNAPGLIHGWAYYRNFTVLHFDFYKHSLFLQTTAFDQTTLWISELSKFENISFPVIKRHENACFKQTMKFIQCQA